MADPANAGDPNEAPEKVEKMLAERFRVRTDPMN